MKLVGINGNDAYVRGGLIRSATVDGDGDITIRFRGEESRCLLVKDTPENRRKLEEHLEALDRVSLMIRREPLGTCIDCGFKECSCGGTG